MAEPQENKPTGVWAIGLPLQHALAWAMALLVVLILSMLAGSFGSDDFFTGPRHLLQHAWWLVLAGVLWLLWEKPLSGRWCAGDEHPEAAAACIAATVWALVVLGYTGLIGPLVAGVGWATLMALALLLLGVKRAQQRGMGSVLRRSLKMHPVDWRWQAGFALLVLPSVGLLLTAAACPPGSLWASEANGYDVLSYHLPLPMAWQEAGRAGVLEHNVYSALPLYAETAFATLSAGMSRLLTGIQPRAVMLASGWHAGLALVLAWVIGRGVAAIGRGWSVGDRRWAGLVAAAFVLAVPWVIVTGSLAYNEHLVNVCFAAALLVAIVTNPGLMHAAERAVASGRGLGRLGPVWGSVLIGFLLGIATGAKPSSFFLAVPVVAAAMVAFRRPQQCLLMFTTAGVTGLVALSPWLIRNWIELGNPVFPYATDLFGSAHWSDEQVARWLSAHEAEGSLGERFARVFGPRGLGHGQWGVFGLAVVVLGGFAVAARPTRRLAAVLLVGLVMQLIAWCVVGHQQSRFLLPMVVPGGLLVGLAWLGGTSERVGNRATRVGRAVAVASVVLLIAQSWLTYLAQNSTNGSLPGAPARGLVLGVDGFVGRPFFEELDALDGQERWHAYQQVGPTVAINHGLSREITRAIRDGQVGASAHLLLVGDATPLYYLQSPGLRVAYATTWDKHPLAEALRASNNDVPSSLRALRAAGITHLLINTNELSRLARSGYLDEALTPEAIMAIMTASGDSQPSFVPMMDWHEGSIVLLGPGGASLRGETLP